MKKGEIQISLDGITGGNTQVVPAEACGTTTPTSLPTHSGTTLNAVPPNTELLVNDCVLEYVTDSLADALDGWILDVTEIVDGALAVVRVNATVDAKMYKRMLKAVGSHPQDISIIPAKSVWFNPQVGTMAMRLDCTPNNTSIQGCTLEEMQQQLTTTILNLRPAAPFTFEYSQRDASLIAADNAAKYLEIVGFPIPNTVLYPHADEVAVWLYPDDSLLWQTA